MSHEAHDDGNGWLAGHLKQAVPALKTLKARNGGDFPADAVYATIDGRRSVSLHGPRTMPVWGEIYTTKARADDKGVPGEAAQDKVVHETLVALIAYIAQLQE